MMDFSAVCRTCLGTDALNPIFTEDVDHRQHATAIFRATGIRVQSNDALPQQMCTYCVRRMSKYLRFHVQCKESERKLLQQSHTCNQNKQSTTKTTVHESSEILLKQNVNDMIKTELKCEFEEQTNTSENGSDIENEMPLSCFTDPIREGKESEDVEGKREEEIQMNENELLNRKNKVERVSCPECQKDLSRRSLSAHLRIKHGGLRCGYCKIECSSKEALEAHSASCPHKRKRRVCESSKELVTCEVCQKVMQRASLRMHQAVKHKGLGPVCEHCGRRFGNKLRLSEHLRAKHGHDKLQCTRCDFKSSSRTALENHERRHRGEKPFVCETCGAKFHAAYLLAQHRHSHRTDKRVKCSVCGAAFKSSNSLHAHRLARHGARRHQCPHCARAYSCRHYAVKHVRSVHGFKGTVPPLRVEPAPS